ncbi:tetratricopeptide repeat protein [Rhodoferax sp. 4810]|nr:tetratricopeptide repeat protein [Rhodoferax jenense]
MRIERAVRRHQPLTTIANALSKDGIPAALTVLDTLLEQRTDNRLELLRIKADLALRIGDLDLATTACQTAQIERPLPWALTLLGQIAQQRGDITTAESLFRQSIAQTSHFMPAHDRLAELCLIQGRRTEALNILKIASERSPKSLQRQRRLAQLAIEMDRPDLAEPAWQRVLTLSRYAGAVQTADYFDLIMTLIKQDDLRQAKKRLELMEKQRHVDPQAQWWIFAAQLNYLHAKAAPIERQQAVLVEIDAALTDNKPTLAAATKLSEALTCWGETARATAIMEDMAA